MQQADLGKPDILRTDASSRALGSALMQEKKEEERPIKYASRLFITIEKNYSSTKREALVVVWAMEKSRSYNEGDQVTVATYH